METTILKWETPNEVKKILEKYKIFKLKIFTHTPAAKFIVGEELEFAGFVVEDNLGYCKPLDTQIYGGVEYVELVNNSKKLHVLIKDLEDFESMFEPIHVFTKRVFKISCFELIKHKPTTLSTDGLNTKD